MKLFFEGYAYSPDLLSIFFANEVGLSSVKNGKIITSVGYYFNQRINDSIFILPKVFLSKRNLAFDRYNPSDIVELQYDNNPLKANADDEAVFELSAWLYQAISHFLERNQKSTISSDVQIQNIRPLGEKGSKTIIEFILSLKEFQKKHRNLFTYISLVKSSGNNKVHWNKTISKVQPVFEDDAPYYMEFRNKKKVINFDEERIVLFYSVLNYLEQKYPFKFEMVKGYEVFRPSKIESLIESKKGTRILKSIRRKYFTDELVQLWRLLYAFFDYEEQIGANKTYQEKLLVSNFNLVFEDMIDQLISDSRKDIPKQLHDQPDGKIVDHIFRDRSIIEEDRMIYFIGDSKYYKDTTEVEGTSIYKQFTYARNVIQYNINLFNDNYDDSVFRYRDTLTEGYNVTPNFFIRGNIDFNDPRSPEMNLEKSKEKEIKERNEHFKNRLFDRDTLFLQTYDINFMYVVTSYVNNSDNKSIKKAIKTMFRNDFLAFIEKRFEFSVLVPKHDNLTELVEKYFKKLLGKIYQPAEANNLLILALDEGKQYQFENLQLISQIEEDFDIYEYHLGTNPEKAIQKEVPYHYYGARPVETLVAAESNEAAETYYRDSQKIAQYKQTMRSTVLFGVYKDAEHLAWIKKNGKYNVRLGDRVGAIKRNRQVTTASYLILYEFRNENNFSVYKLSNKHFVWDGVKMRETGYPLQRGGENYQYFIYDIIGETDDLGEIDLEAVLNQQRKMFEKDNNSPMAEGTPIYVYENELRELTD